MTFLILSLQMFKLTDLQLINQVASRTEVAKRELDIISELAFSQKTPTFGFDNIAANTRFIQFLQYFGDDELRGKTDYGLSVNFFESVLRHDPYYKKFYFFLSSTTSVYAGNPEASVELMNQGLEHMAQKRPEDSYYVWRYKGIDELLFLGDSEAAQHSFQMAEEWANEIGTQESLLIAKESRQLAEALAKNPDSKQVRINAWSNVLAATSDDSTREKAVREIRLLGGDVIFSEDGGIQIKYSTESGMAAHQTDG